MDSKYIVFAEKEFNLKQYGCVFISCFQTRFLLSLHYTSFFIDKKNLKIANMNYEMLNISEYKWTFLFLAFLFLTLIVLQNTKLRLNQ